MGDQKDQIHSRKHNSAQTYYPKSLRHNNHVLKQHLRAKKLVPPYSASQTELEKFYPVQSNKTASLLTAEESQKIIYDWNNTKSDIIRNGTIHQQFEQHAFNRPNHPALYFGKEVLTYDELNTQANQLAHHLREKGVTSNSLVAVSLESSFGLIVSILAILKAGGAYIPLDPNYPIERLNFMLRDTKASILITHSAFEDRYRKSGTPIICLDHDANQIAKFSSDNLNCVNHENDLAYIIYTSGSTGLPKGVMITHKNITHFIHWFSKALTITEEDIFDFSSSISFDFSVSNTLFPLAVGAKIAIYPEADRNDTFLYLNHLIESKITIVKLTFSHFKQLKESVLKEHEFNALRYIVLGGELSFSKDVREWLSLYPHHKILNEYGPTETTIATSWIQVDKNNIDHFKKTIPIGKPVLNSQLYILNKELQPVPIGIIGELYIGGLGVAKGYLNRPEINTEKFIQNPFVKDQDAKLYKSGDLCRYLPDGNIEFIDRVDNQVKIRGFRIEINEIETSLRSFEFIKEAVVVGQKKQSGDKYLVAYYVAKDKQIIPRAIEIRKHLQKTVPDYMIPSVFVQIESLPLSPNGKLDRKSLPEPELQSQEDYLEPRTLLEKSIALIWSDVLNINQIGINENFFELGGHSLLAARIISKIIKSEHKDIKLADFYNAPTIARLAVVVERAKKISTARYHSTQLQDDHGLPLSEMQLLYWLAQSFYSVPKGLNIVSRKQLTGRLNLARLKAAFELLIKKHQILSYSVGKILPMQYPQRNMRIVLQEKHLERLTNQEVESELSASFKNLKTYNRWKAGRPLLLGRYFYLPHNQSEIQICISHLASDDTSAAIIFADLSEFYLHDQTESHYDNTQYKDYISQERHHINISLTRDMNFWQQYLNICSLVSFPKKDVTRTLYTTSIELPEYQLRLLQLYCAQNGLSITDSICAIVGIAIKPYLENDQHNPVVAINLVKSTRDNEIYDDTVGFFVRPDLLRIDLAGKDLLTLAKNTQKSITETAPYQSCPGIVKFAYLFQKYWQGKALLNSIVKLIALAYTKLFYKLKLNPHVLEMYGRVYIAKSKYHFLIQINVFHNFMFDDNDEPKNLFGFKCKPIHYRHQNLSIAKNVLDISFQRDSHHKAYIVLSGNLSAKLRDQIGHTILKIISEIKTSP